MEAWSYWILVATAMVLCAAGCSKQQQQIDVANYGLLGGWPEEVAVHVEPVNSATEIDGLRPEELQVLVEKMLNLMDVEVVEANTKGVLTQFVVNVELWKNPQTGLYRYKTGLRFSKLKGYPNDSGVYSVTTGPGDVQTSNSKEVSKEELSKAVRRDLSGQLLGVWTLLFGPSRLDNLSETTLNGLLGEPNGRPGLNFSGK